MNKNVDKMTNKKKNSNLGLKSFNLKTVKMDSINDSLVSHDINKNKKSINGGLNLINKGSNNKNIKNLSEEDSIFSSKNNKIEKKNIKKIKKSNKKLNKIIVDNIDNIYSNISKLPNRLLKQRIFLLIITFYVSSLHWIFLFLTKRKMQRDYCYTKYNQFEVCIPEEYCSRNTDGKVNYHIYNDTFDVHNSSLNSYQKFMEEMKLINEYYKPFFVNYNYLISQNKLYLLKDMTKKNIDRFNFVIILSKKEKWNIFLNYFSYCDKDLYYFYILGIVFFGGVIGSLILGTFADVYGRKKLIIISLFIVTLSLIFITIICYKIERNYNNLLNEFQKKYISSKNNSNYEILSKYYSQFNTEKNFRSYSILFILSLLLLSFGLRPLSKISLSLLLENCTSELKAIEIFRRFTFITTALPPFIIAHILIILNRFIYLFLFFTLSFFILFICSFFLLNESLRYLYEFCEWKELTKELLNLFKISDNTSINFMNKVEYETFRYQENKIMFENSFKTNNCSNKIKSKYDIIKKRFLSLSRDIKRNCQFIIKTSEAKFNPFIIYLCLKSNRAFMDSRYLLLIIMFIIYSQEYFIEREILEIPFFGLSDLYFDKNNNIIINSNFFALGIVIFISNYIYYFFYRISYFNSVLIFSLMITTILFFIYHYINYALEDFPADLSQFNFVMSDIPHIKDNNYKTHILLFFIEFFFNGISFYINILIIKLSKTLYRCTFFAINTILFLASMGLGDIIIFQIKRYFFLVGSLNFVSILTVIFLGEFKNIANLINDLKRSVYKEKKLKID